MDKWTGIVYASSYNICHSGAQRSVRKFAVLASALVFTIMHTQVQSFIPVFGAGVLLACIYLHTDNIFSTM
ncbi:MAG: CPBP family intramembrane metalloprotease, partial [Oscillospiraceae bacterium]|nr:CPBP family intramembrane metalloprotease [Oscillospiraceae bacterium]